MPWHDPVRVAEEIALLDVLSGGRCLFGFGRGAASVEYAGFRIPVEEARPRFVEAAQIIVKALTHEVFDWDGAYFHIPPTSIRPRPMVTEFAYGGMPHEESEINMRLFADRVMPVLQRDPAFAVRATDAAAESSSAPVQRAGGVLAPA